jgi:hypothetical protein
MSEQTDALLLAIVPGRYAARQAKEESALHELYALIRGVYPNVAVTLDGLRSAMQGHYLGSRALYEDMATGRETEAVALLTLLLGLPPRSLSYLPDEPLTYDEIANALLEELQ